MSTCPKCPKVSERTESDAGISVRNVRCAYSTGQFGRPPGHGHTALAHRLKGRAMKGCANCAALANLLPILLLARHTPGDAMPKRNAKSLRRYARRIRRLQNLRPSREGHVHR